MAKNKKTKELKKDAHVNQGLAKGQVLVANRKIESYKAQGYKEIDISTSNLDKQLKDNLLKNRDMVLMQKEK